MNGAFVIIMDNAQRIDSPFMAINIRRFFLLFVMLCGSITSAFAQEFDERRLSVGIKIFPAVLAADTQIFEKAEEGFLRILVLYNNDEEYARQVANALHEIKSIKGIPVVIEIKSFSDLTGNINTRYGAVFVSQNLFSKIDKVVAYGIHNKILTFSPIKGDVESGVASGFFVSDQIRPYINQRTIEDSEIELKDFFVKVAKSYNGEPK